jgi:hypothetical protein
MAKFIQVNMNRAAVAQAELSVKLVDMKLEVALLQEPVTYMNRLVQIPPRFEGFPSQTLATRPRAAIYAKKSLKLIAHCTVRQQTNGAKRLRNSS